MPSLAVSPARPVALTPLVLALCLCACASQGAPSHPSAPPPAPPPTPAAVVPWLKGQLHLHTNRSGDSNTPPDDVVAWYARHGYDFIVITDHNVITTAASTPSLLVLPGVEITQNYRSCLPPEGEVPCRIHVNGLFVDPRASSVDDLLPPSSEVPDRLSRYLIGAELARRLHGIAQVNHPNYRLSAGLPVLREVLRHGPALLEVANESVGCGNDGDATHPSTEALWDALWTEGLTVWGTATDDAHHYDDGAEVEARGEVAYTGDRGWVMVRSRKTPQAIRDAIAQGAFYFSTGVALSTVELRAGQLHVVVDPSSEAPVVIRFIGDGGRELASAQGKEAAYTLGMGGISYVRAVVTDARGRKAWTQPVR